MVQTQRTAFANDTAAIASLPLVASVEADVPIAWYRQRPVSRVDFLADVQRVARLLPARRYALNLCENRYLFLVGFAAAAVRAQISLLPTTRAPVAIDETTAQFPDNGRIDDRCLAAWIDADADADAAGRPAEGEPWVSAEQVAAIAFTSGSTGRQQPHLKRWGELVAGARLAERRFGFALSPGTTVVATVPPQHMYGLETSVMLPLTVPVALHAQRPLLPEEVIAALAAVPPPRVLVTTPVHLRVFAETRSAWPSIALVISATAPLTRALAEAAEAALAAPVMEIYGCTEVGSIASRRTVTEEAWTPYDGFSVSDGWVAAEHLQERLRLNDTVDVGRDGRFILRGRRQDMVNIAGKRTSLAYLNRLLGEIDGIEDGAFVMPEEAGERPVRLAALVVAPDLDRRDVLAALAQRIDPIFLPRPLLLVDRLPRNDFGKLRRDALLDLVRAAKRTLRGEHG